MEPPPPPFGPPPSGPPQPPYLGGSPPGPYGPPGSHGAPGLHGPPQPPYQGGPPPAYAPPYAPPTQSGRRGRTAGIVAGIVAGVLVLCGGAVALGVVVIDRSGVLDEAGDDPTDPPAPTGPVDWVALQGTTPETATLWEDLAGDFEATGGGEVFVQPLPSDAYPALLSSRMNVADPPDLYSSTGGNRLRRQVEAGMVRDLTTDLADVIATIPPGVLAPYTVDGRVYGLPYHTGTLGIWYNKALFAGAGLDPDRPPQTWDEYLAAVAALKAAGTTPVALAGAESWTVSFWYGCLATRVAGVDAFVAAGQQRSLSENPDFLRAAQLLVDFIDAEPFQPGYEAAHYATPGGQAELVASGQAAMELMGGWAPTTYEVWSSGQLGDDLGWFPFPAVEGGNGSIADLHGGSDGFAVGINAPDATIELLRFLFSNETYQRILAADTSLISVRVDAAAPAGDPNLGLQMAAIHSAPAMQPYLDADLPAVVSGDLFDSMGQLLTGATTPEEALARITAGWQAAPDL
jgi:raffinose/stachyose/melibiose transport system substrate-binding protein